MTHVDWISDREPNKTELGPVSEVMYIRTGKFLVSDGVDVWVSKYTIYYGDDEIRGYWECGEDLSWAHLPEAPK